MHSSRSGSHTESVFKAYYPQPLAFELELRQEGLGARIAKAFGGQDVTTGEPAFDAAVRVRSGQPEQAAAFLRNAERQAAVLQALQAFPQARFGRTHLSVSRQGRLKNDEQIKEVLAVLVKAAGAIAG
jgi:hypothetical protein